MAMMLYNSQPPSSMSAEVMQMAYQGMHPVLLPRPQWACDSSSYLGKWSNTYTGADVTCASALETSAKDVRSRRGFKAKHVECKSKEDGLPCGWAASHAAACDTMETLADSKERCKALVACLEKAESEGDAETIHNIIISILDVALPLSLSSHGCRVVQKALGAADSTDLDKLVAKLEPHAVQLYESENANHVLSKIIEVTPSSQLTSIVSQLLQKGTETVARHRFGCRVLERLISHCTELEASELLDGLIAKASALCRHEFGNFVVKQLLEHDEAHRRSKTLTQLMPNLPYLAMHKTASHVVQKALESCDEDEQSLMIDTLLRAESPNSLLNIACARYGSFVGKQLVNLPTPLSVKVRQHFVENYAELISTQYGKNVALQFGLEVAVA